MAAARLGLQEAEDALTNLRPDYGLRLAEAVQTKADAEAALDAALETLAGLDGDYSLRLAEAVQAKADAERSFSAAWMFPPRAGTSWRMKTWAG